MLVSASREEYERRREERIADLKRKVLLEQRAMEARLKIVNAQIQQDVRTPGVEAPIEQFKQYDRFEDSIRPLTRVLRPLTSIPTDYEFFKVVNEIALKYNVQTLARDAGAFVRYLDDSKLSHLLRSDNPILVASTLDNLLNKFYLDYDKKRLEAEDKELLQPERPSQTKINYLAELVKLPEKDIVRLVEKMEQQEEKNGKLVEEYIDRDGELVNLKENASKQDLLAWIYYHKFGKSIAEVQNRAIPFEQISTKKARVSRAKEAKEQSGSAYVDALQKEYEAHKDLMGELAIETKAAKQRRLSSIASQLESKEDMDEKEDFDENAAKAKESASLWQYRTPIRNKMRLEQDPDRKEELRKELEDVDRVLESQTRGDTIGKINIRKATRIKHLPKHRELLTELETTAFNNQTFDDAWRSREFPSEYKQKEEKVRRVVKEMTERALKIAHEEGPSKLDDLRAKLTEESDQVRRAQLQDEIDALKRIYGDESDILLTEMSSTPKTFEEKEELQEGEEEFPKTPVSSPILETLYEQQKKADYAAFFTAVNESFHKVPSKEGYIAIVDDLKNGMQVHGSNYIQQALSRYIEVSRDASFMSPKGTGVNTKMKKAIAAIAGVNQPGPKRDFAQVFIRKLATDLGYDDKAIKDILS